MDTAEIEATMLRMLERCGPGKTLDPTEVARELGGPHPDGWSPYMPLIRRTAVRLARAGRLVILRKGRPVDLDDFRGIYRLSLPAAAD